MKVIAAGLNDEYLISATHKEIIELVRATRGSTISTRDGCVGITIPAYDYAAKVKEVKEFASSDSFKYFKDKSRTFTIKIEELVESIESIDYKQTEEI